MPSFKSKKSHTTRSFIIYYLAQAAFLLLAAALLVYLGILKEPAALATLILPAALMTINFIGRSRQLLVNEIDINTSNNIITFYLYSFWKGDVQRTELLDKIKIEIDNKYSEGLFRKSTPAIFFFYKHPGTLYVSSEKDHFSEQMITDLAFFLNGITTKSIPAIS